MYKQNNPNNSSPDYSNDEPTPFSGLVILFAIGLGVTVLVTMFELKLCYDFMKSNSFDLTTNSGLMPPYYVPMPEPLMYLELIVKFAIFLSALALLILLIDKSWLFIKWVRVYLVAGVFIQIAETVAILSLRATMEQKQLIDWYAIDPHIVLALAAVGPLITLLWLGYFSSSERVRRIFIN